MICSTNNFSVLNKDHFHYFITATDQNTPKRQFTTKILAVQHFISVHKYYCFNTFDVFGFIGYIIYIVVGACF